MLIDSTESNPRLQEREYYIVHVVLGESTCIVFISNSTPHPESDFTTVVFRMAPVVYQHTLISGRSGVCTFVSPRLFHSMI